MSASKQDMMEDNQLHFSGESKDWSRFKQEIQSRADRYDTTWLFEGGRACLKGADNGHCS